MEPVPDGWPPAGAPQTAIAPLFPLPRQWLIPGRVVPLHIFEERYRKMIEDSLDSPGRIVMGTVMEGHEHELMGSPPCYPVAGIGEIGRHVRLPNGRFNIWLIGLTRVRMRETESDAPYRRVEVEQLHEVDASPQDDADLRESLTEAVLERSPGYLNLPDELPIGRLADILLVRIDLPADVGNGLFAELDVAARARAALDEHRRRPIPPPGEEDRQDPFPGLG